MDEILPTPIIQILQPISFEIIRQFISDWIAEINNLVIEHNNFVTDGQKLSCEI